MANSERIALLETAEAHHAKVSERAKGSAGEAIAAGRALLAAKAAAPAKGWLPALKSHTSMKQDKAQRYMVLARATGAGLLAETIGEMSFSQAYRLAIRQAARIARKATAGAPPTDAAVVAERQEALKTFRHALRAAVSAGVSFRILEQELAKRAGAELLASPAGEIVPEAGAAGP
jgi:hypothetical protein